MNCDNTLPEFQNSKGLMQSHKKEIEERWNMSKILTDEEEKNLI